MEKKRFIRTFDVPERVIEPGRTSRKLVSEESVGITSFSMGVHSAEPGLRIRPQHAHDIESETMFVLEGTVKFMIGDEEFICEPYSMVVAPAGVPHTYEVIGNEPVKFIWIYEPPLPDSKNPKA